ncbi:hypothetical protein PG993_007337 [Apiospora rasikravindrae]|uniref:DUF6594 domain-containing protein n=1 Tax=Apiospora rasikravindrae TaxID=990691 RepID=A0ABR1SX75_9PEZI
MVPLVPPVQHRAPIPAQGTAIASGRTGYSLLADFISRSPENAIFRKFGLLNTINLLRLQAELVDLEQQLDDVWSLDRNASPDSENNSRDAKDRRLYGLDFWHMRKCKEEGKDSIQLDLLEDIGKKLDEYSNYHHPETNSAGGANPDPR